MVRRMLLGKDVVTLNEFQRVIYRRRAMIDIEEVAERIYHLETSVPGAECPLSAYLIHEEKGVLIEPGPTTAIPLIQEGMKQLGMAEISYIIPTHVHIDHAGAVGKLAELFPQAKVVLHPQGVKHAVDPSRLIQSTRMAFGDDFEVRYGPILPVPESQVKVPVDGEMLSINGRELQVIYAPGHAPHQIAIFDKKTGGLFCGEALGFPRKGAESSPIPTASPPSFDMEAYLKTIKRLRELSPRVLFYSHDGVGREPDKLISRVEENTKIFSDIILKALREGETSEAIDYRIRGYISSHFGVNMEKVNTTMSVKGFILYFKKKRLA